MTERDEFVRRTVEPMLQPGEQLLNVAFVKRMPDLLLQIVYALCCIWLLIFQTTNFYAALTNRRIILIKTQFWLFRPKIANLGVEEISLQGATNVTFGGFLANQSFTIHKAGSQETLRIAPSLRLHAGQKTFKEDVRSAAMALATQGQAPGSGQ